MASDSPADADLDFPSIELEQLEDVSPAATPGFLRLVRRRLIARYPDGSVSDAFLYDEIDRRAIDAEGNEVAFEVIRSALPAAWAGFKEGTR